MVIGVGTAIGLMPAVPSVTFGVEEEVRYDLTETQRHDREVVATQAQGRRAEEHSEDGGDEPGECIAGQKC